MRSEPSPHSTAFLKQLQEQRTAESDRKGGLGKLAPVAIVLLFGFPILIPIALVGGLIYVLVRKAGKSSREDRPRREKKRKPSEAKAFVASPTFTAGEDGLWLSVEKQLQQAEVLKDAGILSPEEYRLWKSRIQDYNKQ